MPSPQLDFLAPEMPLATQVNIERFVLMAMLFFKHLWEPPVPLSNWPKKNTIFGRLPPVQASDFDFIIRTIGPNDGPRLLELLSLSHEAFKKFQFF